MKEIFKELITNFHTSSIPKPFKRNLELPIFPPHVRKGLVLIGMRRSGKTWSFYQIMHDLMKKGIEHKKILYINFEDERLSFMQSEHFQDIVKAYFELYPELLQSQDIHFFFDEIHEVPGWEKFIRRLLDQEKMSLYLSGSSCKMLSKEIATSLRGRTIAKEIFPFSFREYLQCKPSGIPKNFGTKQKIELMHHVHSFLRLGGFPEVIEASIDIHRTILQEYVATVIYRDIIERYNVGSVHVLKQLLSHCLRNSAALLSVNKMYNTFKSMGYAVGKNILYDYLTHFEDAYCLFSLEKFDISIRKSAQSIKKVFTVDQGLVTAFSMASDFDLAKQLETAVFSYLRRKSSDLFYYSTQTGKEVDFLLLLPDQSIQLFQVSVTLQDSHARRREINALEQAMQELQNDRGTIVTLEEEEEIVVSSGTIYCRPIWKLLLDIE